MDLLPTPADSSDYPTEAAAYVCNDLWDGGPFLSFPIRSGKIGWIPANVRASFAELRSDELWTELGTNAAPPAEKEPFLQRWLFFGLIAEFSGLNRQEDGTSAVRPDVSERELVSLHEKYTREDEDGRWILTGLPIVDFAQELLQRLRASSSDSEMAARLTQLWNCLHLTYLMINLTAQELVNPYIRYSIGALGEYLSSLIQFGQLAELIKSPSQLAPPFPWGGGYLQSMPGLKAHMLTKGWCRSDFARADEMYSSLSTKHLLSRLRKPLLNRDHSRCNDVECLTAQSLQEDYRPAHVTDNCICLDVEIDISAIQAILERGDTYPVLKFEVVEGVADTVMKVEERKPNTPYVAISHVWVDGLGNPLLNAIPKCQISRLAVLVKDLEKRVPIACNGEWPPYSSLLQKNDGEVGTYRLWIDTLCCPVETEGKLRTLKKMPDIYRNAAHVLVLDSTLFPFKAASMGPAEATLRMWALSNWMRRLWCLQEGALAKSLWFCFSDMTIKAYDALFALAIIAEQDLRQWRVMAEVKNELYQLSGFFPDESNPYSAGEFRAPVGLYEVQRTIFFRSVSVASDEPICLSTLLNLDTDYVLGVDDVEERMIRFWDLFSKKNRGLPASLVFSPDKTCQIPGWRWAPLSLVNPDLNGYEGMAEKTLRFIGHDNERVPMGSPCRYGFRTQLRGYHLRVRAVPSKAVINELFEEIRRPGETFVLFKDANTGKLYSLMDRCRSVVTKTYDDKKLDRYDENAGSPIFSAIATGECALIHKPPPRPFTPIDQFSTALLVHITGKIEEIRNSPPQHEKVFGFQVRRLREVVQWKMESKFAAVYDKIDEMASQVTAGFARAWLSDCDTLEDESREDARADLRKRMMETMDRALNEDKDFRESLTATFDAPMKTPWRLLANFHFRYLELIEAPSDQIWYFD